MNLPHILGRLPERFRWTLHNVLGHPIFEVLSQLGLRRWADTVHDLTVPDVAGGAR